MFISGIFENWSEENWMFFRHILRFLAVLWVSFLASISGSEWHSLWFLEASGLVYGSRHSWEHCGRSFVSWGDVAGSVLIRGYAGLMYLCCCGIIWFRSCLFGIFLLLVCCVKVGMRCLRILVAGVYFMWNRMVFEWFVMICFVAK